jgi:transcriptional regulator with XRE-family HTH domain
MKARQALRHNIKMRRKALGFKSSAAFAAHIGASPVTVARIESESGNYPEEATLSLIARGLGCDESDLFQDPRPALMAVRTLLGGLASMDEDQLVGVLVLAQGAALSAQSNK